MLATHLTFFLLYWVLCVIALPQGLGDATNPSSTSPNPPAPTFDPRQIPPAVRTVCDGLPGIPRSIEKVPGSDLTVTGGDCPPQLDVDFEVKGGCNFPPNTCDRFGGGGILGFAKCGAGCGISCYGGLGGPDPNDCEVIFNNFRNRGDKIFKLGRDRFLLFTWKTCGTGIQNQIRGGDQGCTADMIYDYPDWAGHGSDLAWGCQATQNARGGKCVAFGGEDFYIQLRTCLS